MKEKKIKLLKAAIHCVENDIDFGCTVNDTIVHIEVNGGIVNDGLTTYENWKCFDEKIAIIMETK